MRVSLLYSDRDPERLEGAYADAPDIIRDLGLETMFTAAGRKLIRENGDVKRLDREDGYLSDTLRRVMMIPLASREEILYRQDILRDSLGREELLRALYRLGGETARSWDVLGRSFREKAQQRNPAVKLLEDIQVLRLLCDALRDVREVLTQREEGTGKPLWEGFASEGLRSFAERFLAAFPETRESRIRGILEDLAFFSGGEEKEDDRQSLTVWTMKPRMVLECGLEDGLKFSSLRLRELKSERVKFHRPGTTMKKLQELRFARVPDSFPVEKDPRLSEQAKQMEYAAARYLTDSVLTGMLEDFRTFFDQLKRQTAFYLAAVTLMDHMTFYGLETCFPEVTDRETLSFRELREGVMGLEWRRRIIGNTCDLSGKRLLIVTGANQGGKSTFLRSIGIAQVMLQCGLPVTAQAFRSGIFPRIFVHFTRREDSTMNSGRLDEELGRMSRIVDQLGEGSLVLLNESFATTTEKEGSVIAWDITRALKEAGVKLLMVTHLLSFARRMYEAAGEAPEADTAFLSAERRPDGTRTYRMLPHAPELTSFGLDLYEEIVEGKRKR